MLSKIYAVYDNKAEAFMEPFFATNAGVALRRFADNVNHPDSIFHKHPNDFCLYEIGAFDDQPGDVANWTENKNLGLAIEFLNQPEHPGQMELVK